MTHKTRKRRLLPHPFEDPSVAKKVKKFIDRLIFEKKAIKGKLEYSLETGMEEIDWCFEPNESSKRARPHRLEDGDMLAIYDPNDKNKIIWSGKILFYDTTHRVNVRILSVPMGRIRLLQKYQKGVAKKKWFSYFFLKYPAALVKKKKTKTSS